ncbi:type II toxin-antitoxin system HicA family toxin [Planktothrix agardhii]|uniref:type II toxin-antitoxin system HicA family toxin n=1 Tax=Planktothrix agardhii TaxID=1160 RepID=UPI000409155C|nr:type II toxin-antitoxin system HicA family toxin [Planktothrix agardhii]
MERVKRNYLESQGWVLKRITGSHYIYENPELEQILSIPVHRNQDLKVGTLRALMKIAELSGEDLLCLNELLQLKKQEIIP